MEEADRGIPAVDAVGAPGGALVGLDPLPVLLDLLRGRRVHVTEDVRVTPDELGDEAAGDVVDVERRLGALLGDPGVEEDLEEDVAELLGEVVAVAVLDGLEHLVRLLDEVGRQGVVRLLGVPRAPARGAQSVHDGDGVEEPGARHVPRADEDLDPCGELVALGTGTPADLGGERVGEPGVAVGGAEPDHPLPRRPVEEDPGQLGRPLGLDDGDPEPCVSDGHGEGVARVPGQPDRDRLERGPRRAGQQARGHPRARHEKDEVRLGRRCRRGVRLGCAEAAHPFDGVGVGVGSQFGVETPSRPVWGSNVP